MTAIEERGECPDGMVRIGGALALMIVVILIGLMRRSNDSLVSSRERKAAIPASAEAREGAKVRPAAKAHQRRVIAGQIATAPALGAARASVQLHASAQRRTGAVEAMSDELRDALRPMMPRLRACYAHALPDLGDPHVTVEVELTLTSDPDIGTLIDADVLLDPKRRLPGSMVDCLRSELQLLELPPLAIGDRLSITYPFVFSPDEP